MLGTLILKIGLSVQLIEHLYPLGYSIISKSDGE